MEPTLLMLDEPTNHLDLNAVIWLDRFVLFYILDALLCLYLTWCVRASYDVTQLPAVLEEDTSSCFS